MRRLRYLWRAFHYRHRVAPREIAFLGRSLRPGDTTVDIGCHKGGFLYWLRRFVTASGSVYGFEPQPQLAQYLREIVKAQGWNNVTIEAAGVSSASGTMPLHVPAPHGDPSPGATLSPAAGDGPHYRIDVPVIALDAYFAQRGEPRIACIKCDCEGHELEVFRGAADILREDRPVLLFECEARHLPGSSPSVVFDFLHGLGYRGYLFYATGLLPVVHFRPDVHQPVRPGRYWDAKDYFNNFAFLPERSDGS